MVARELVTSPLNLPAIENQLTNPTITPSMHIPKS
jgi:hypothetical protein